MFSAGGVKVKVCGLEQFDPCNDRGLWYGSTCQRYASTDHCCKPWSSTHCDTLTQLWVCPAVHFASTDEVFYQQ